MAVIITGLVVVIGGSAYYFFGNRVSEPMTLTDEVPTIGDAVPGAAVSDDEVSMRGWQTYKNPKHPYSVSYPEDWYFYQTGFSPPPPQTIMLADMPEGSPFAEYSSFSVNIDKAMGRTIHNYGEVTNLAGSGYTQKNTTVSGEPAVELTNSDTLTSSRMVYVAYLDQIYRISCTVPLKDAATKMKMCDQLYAQFKFDNKK